VCISADCNSLWSEIVSQHSYSGKQGVGYTTLYACQSLCINTTNCVAIDFDTNQNTCFYFLSPAPAVYPATGVNHYVLVNAPTTTTTTVPTLTSNGTINLKLCKQLEFYLKVVTSLVVMSGRY